MKLFQTRQWPLSILLALIFCGAIVGETVSLSIVVSRIGPAIIGKLYLINGLLLFLLPLLFFNNIDRINRGTLLTWSLLITSLLLFCYCLFFLHGVESSNFAQALVWLLYPVSYLSKTLLFLTFWTLANDMCHTSEAKKSFPQIAAWGFIGGLTGACVSRLALMLVPTEMLILFWAVAYGAGFVICYSLEKNFHARLLPHEQLPENGGGIGSQVLKNVEDVLSIELVRLISVLYFFIFVAIFTLDFLFWRQCHLTFPVSRSLASFQFVFFIAHSVGTISGLYGVMPRLITRMGFPRIFVFFPMTLFTGSLLLLGMKSIAVQGQAVFIAFVIVQFFRHVIFENAFSPVYQMFFASVSREKRGRAKTMLEGIIKPSAILVAGILTLAYSDYPLFLLALVWGLAVILIYVAILVRSTYIKGLVPDLKTGKEPSSIIAQIGSNYDQKILALIREYSCSQDADMRSLAVKILANISTRESFQGMVEIFQSENDQQVREIVARSLSNFYWYEVKEFIERLLLDSNPRIRSNAIYSLHTMNCHWKWRLRDLIKPMLFENHLRVQLEAAQYFWKSDPDQSSIEAFLWSLVQSKNVNRRSAGLYLVGVLKPRSWEKVLVRHITSSSPQVYRKSIEVIFRAASTETQLKTLAMIEVMPRERIAVAGEVLQQIGMPIVKTVLNFMKVASKRRMLFELVHAVRLVLDCDGHSPVVDSVDQDTGRVLSEWMIGELENVYHDCYIWYHYREHLATGSTDTSWQELFESSLKDRLLRSCEWGLDTLALIDRRGMVARGIRDFDLHDREHRIDMIEVVESFAHNKLGKLIVSILENHSWEQLSRTGKQIFHFDSVDDYKDLGYFIQCDNRWVSLCALFGISRQPNAAELVVREREKIESLRSDTNSYLARAAAEIAPLIQPTMQGDFRMETFELLEVVLFLKKTLLFRNVPAEKLMGLAEITRLISYPKGSTVSSEGEISDHLYIVKSGSLRIAKNRNELTTVLSIVRPGEAYGEIGLFNQAPRSASAIAHEDCEVFVIQRNLLKKLIMDIPEIAYNFLEIFSDKLRRSGDELALLHSTYTGKLIQEEQKTV